MEKRERIEKGRGRERRIPDEKGKRRERGGVCNRIEGGNE